MGHLERASDQEPICVLPSGCAEPVSRHRRISAAPAFGPPAGAGSLKPRSPDQDTYRPPDRAEIATTATIRSFAKIARRPSGSFQNLIFEPYAFRIVFL